MHRPSERTKDVDYQEDKSRGGVGRCCKERSAGDMGTEEQCNPAREPAGQQDTQLYALPVLRLLAQHNVFPISLGNWYARSHMGEE